MEKKTAARKLCKYFSVNMTTINAKITTIQKKYLVEVINKIYRPGFIK